MLNFVALSLLIEEKKVKYYYTNNIERNNSNEKIFVF